jgi:hypothetical protein
MRTQKVKTRRRRRRRRLQREKKKLKKLTENCSDYGSSASI